MAKKTVRDIDVAGKRVLVRVDFNVPLKEGAVRDDTRIRAALPTIIYLLDEGAKVILTSHLGRPKKQPKEGLVLNPVAERLGELLNKPVKKLDELTGAVVEAVVAAMKPGEIVLLENSRFDPREEKNDPTLGEELARLADIYVDDAFGTAHRAHATTAGVAEHLPSVSGFLMQKELEALSTLVTAPARPFVVVLGGAKVTDKIGVIEAFLDIADDILIGGAMAFTFYKAKGWPTGSSLVEDEEGVAVAKHIMDKAAGARCNLLLPEDGIVYSNTTDTITLQWSSVGTLRENEVYQVTIEDVTSNGTNRVVQYVTDTKLTVPATLRPVDNVSHIFRWWVVAARQAGSNADGTPIYETNGATSTARVFGWSGTTTGSTQTP